MHRGAGRNLKSDLRLFEIGRGHIHEWERRDDPRRPNTLAFRAFSFFLRPLVRSAGVALFGCIESPERHCINIVLYELVMHALLAAATMSENGRSQST